MKPLPLHDALKLHQLLHPHIPEAKSEDFIGDTIHNIRYSETPTDYFDAVVLMTGKEEVELIKLDIAEMFQLFMDGLVANNIVELKLFCNQIGLGKS